MTQNTGETTNAGPAPSAPPPLAPTLQRKLHIGHFAFMRALVQGLDTKDSWNRYLRMEGEHSDVRVVKRTVDWIRSEFAAAARREDRFGVARLVLLDVSKIPERGPVLPTLQDFAVEHGLEDFTEREQLEQYQAHFGKATAQQNRRGRLINKQLEALRWLESLIAQPPLAGDALASWLHPDVVGYLEKAGLFTIRALMEHVNGIGKRWWAGIHAIGPGKAEGILSWLHTHEATIGLKIGAHVAVARKKLFADELARVVPYATAIVPLEKLIVPAELDGSNGAYRVPQHLCLMRATNDYDALLAWIRSRRGLRDEERIAKKRKRGIDPVAPELELAWLQYLSHTQRAYLKEAERFLLWAVVQHKKPLSSMTLEDCNAYREFLANPTPADLWCGPSGREKWSPLWRPFVGPLSVASQRHAITILKSFYKFLVDQCYLIGNPWNGVLIPQAPRARAARGRSFTQAQWEFIEGQLEMLSATSVNQRLRFALHLFYTTGVRLAEGVALKVDDLNWVAYPGSGDDDELIEGWELTVLGKGNKERIVPVPIEVVSELSRYLDARALDIDPQAAYNQGAYLLGRAMDVAETAPWAPAARHEVDGKAGIAPGTLYDQLKKFFFECAQVLANIDEKGAERLARASTHWLRHTHGSHSVAAGTPLDIVQQNMGHASIDTTTIYVTSEDRRRMKAMQKFWGRAAGNRSAGEGAKSDVPAE